MEVFLLKSGKGLKLNFSLRKSSTFSKICSGHMECSFGNSADFVLPETQKILAQCPKVRKVLFLPDSRPLECSTGRVECLTDEPWVFLQIRFSSEKPSKDIKLYLPPNKVLPKSSSGHVDFVFDTLVENFCHKSGISSLKIRKECQTYFFWGKKPVCLKDFFWTYGMRCWQLRQKCSAKKPSLSRSLPKSQKVLVSAKIISPKCSAPLYT